MLTYTFKDADGVSQAVDLEDNVFEEICDVDYKIRLCNRKERRHCQSLEASMEKGFDIADPNADIIEILDKKQRDAELYAAIAKLSPEQQQLVSDVYLDGKSQSAIAKRQGVSKVAIHLRLQVILKKLKEFLS